ncbi:MAG TPA: hypothetical protein VF399_04300 [bacterium]
MKREIKKKTTGKNKITVHVDRRRRTPHKPTIIHKDKKKYTRKGKQQALRRWQDLLGELGS